MEIILTSIIAFASTNLDDIFLLILFPFHRSGKHWAENLFILFL